MGTVRLARTPLGGKRLYGEFQDCASGFTARSARASLHKNNYRAPHFFWRIKKALVNPQLAATITHNHGAIPRQPYPVSARQASAAKFRLEFLGSFGSRSQNEIERKLVFVAREKPRESAQRLKQRCEPGTKFFASGDQTRV